jgi:Large ribosomal RNA subunit accumulation protein YceD
MTAKTPAKSASKTLWSVPVRREHVPESGLHLDLVADDASRAAIAAIAAINALPRLEARFDVMRQGDGLTVSGEVSASVGQHCVVTLEPMTSEVCEPIDLTFVPPAVATHADALPDEIDPDAADEPEPLVGGVVDLGRIATEFLLLAIDPYPRKPGAVFEAPEGGDPGAHPFAALATLKKGPPKP